MDQIRNVGKCVLSLFSWTSPKPKNEIVDAHAHENGVIDNHVEEPVPGTSSGCNGTSIRYNMRPRLHASTPEATSCSVSVHDSSSDEDQIDDDNAEVEDSLIRKSTRLAEKKHQREEVPTGTESNLPTCSGCEPNLASKKRNFAKSQNEIAPINPLTKQPPFKKQSGERREIVRSWSARFDRDERVRKYKKIRVHLFKDGSTKYECMAKGACRARGPFQAANLKNHRNCGIGEVYKCHQGCHKEFTTLKSLIYHCLKSRTHRDQNGELRKSCKECKEHLRKLRAVRDEMRRSRSAVVKKDCCDAMAKTKDDSKTEPNSWGNVGL